jgi:hypothetical protein
MHIWRNTGSVSSTIERTEAIKRDDLAHSL